MLKFFHTLPLPSRKASRRCAIEYRPSSERQRNATTAARNAKNLALYKTKTFS